MDVKKKIAGVVKQYIKDYPSEFELLKEAVVMRRALNAHGFEKKADMRPLYELSDTLHTMLNLKLEEDEMTWFKSKKGGNWFAKEFKIFSLI